MISNYTLTVSDEYRFVGKKLFRLPYIDKAGRQQPLKQIKKVQNSSDGYWLMLNGKKKFCSLSWLRKHLKKERMEISGKEPGMPF